MSEGDRLVSVTRDSILALVRLLDVPLGLFEPVTRCSHLTPRLRALLASMARPESLLEAMAVLARRMCEDALRHHAPSGPDAGTAHELTAEFHGSHRLHAVHFPHGTLGAECVAILLQDVHGADGFDPLPLRARYRLTDREIEVAGLIVKGMSTDGLARHLGIARHTARRHIESVMGKADAHSRVELLIRLLGREEAGAISPTPEHGGSGARGDWAVPGGRPSSPLRDR